MIWFIVVVMTLSVISILALWRWVWRDSKKYVKEEQDRMDGFTRTNIAEENVVYLADRRDLEDLKK